MQSDAIDNTVLAVNRSGSDYASPGSASLLQRDPKRLGELRIAIH
jgi:hypothetical protein